MTKKVMAIASAGGHLVQLMRLFPAFGEDYLLVSTSPVPPHSVDESKYSYIQDCNADEFLNLIICFVSCIKIIIKQRPQIVITTGAAPGLLVLIVARFLGVKCIWFDSIANTERLSLGGRIAKNLTKYCFSQWKHVAEKEKVGYIGSIL